MRNSLLPYLLLPVMMLALLYPVRGDSQSLPIGGLQDEQLRLQFLLSDSLYLSTVNRPFSRRSYRIFTERTMSETDISRTGWWTRPVGTLQQDLPAGFRAGAHPVLFQNTYNTRLPHGENNQAAWYGTGLNSEMAGGAWITSDFVTLSLQPHLIWQQNRDFLHPRFTGSSYGAEGIGTILDAPFRFGPDPYWTFDWGYSSLRLHYRQFEVGLSSEPLWWGPAVRYPLMMSNNAPGIPHAFIGTRERFHVPYMGYFQFRWILGYPEESGYFEHSTAGETRFTNALNAAWSPAFLPALTLGLTRTYHLYEENGFDWDNVLVMFDPFQKSELEAEQGMDRQSRNQTATVYAQLLIPGADAEIYGELYREDHSYDWRDFLQQPHHNSAWSFGFQKIFFAPLADMYKMNVEFTNLNITQIEQVRHQAYYYTHGRIRQGHTSGGQLLGAAIGPGSSSQFLGVDGYRGDYKVGLSVQRVVENDRFHLVRNSISSTPHPRFGDYFRHRVNLNLGLNFLYGPGPFYLNGGFIWTKAYNYGRFDYGELQNINASNYDYNDRINLRFQMGITYVF